MFLDDVDVFTNCFKDIFENVVDKIVIQKCLLDEDTKVQETFVSCRVGPLPKRAQDRLLRFDLKPDIIS